MKDVRRLPSPLFVSAGICILFLAGGALGQKDREKTPPAAGTPPLVTSNLHTIFPNATIKRTDAIERNGVVFYRLGIIDGGKKREVVFSTGGVIEEVNDSVGVADLPGPVRQALSRNYPRANIIEADKKTTGAGYVYTIEAVAEKDTMYVIIDKTSMIISSKRCAKKGRTEKNTGLAQN